MCICIVAILYYIINTTQVLLKFISVSFISVPSPFTRAWDRHHARGMMAGLYGVFLLRHVSVGHACPVSSTRGLYSFLREDFLFPLDKYST